MDAGTLRAAASGWAVRGLVTLPDLVLRALAGEPPPQARGLAPDAWLIARLAAAVETSDDAPLDVARRRADVRSRPLSAGPRAPVSAADRQVPGPAGPLRVRVYEPASAGAAPGPLLVFFHGGGWVQRSIESHDASCRLLAHLAGVRLASVEYRLAPEHPFPAAADDALAAFTHITAHAAEFGCDGRVGLAGDSAGGNLAAVTALAAPDAAFQLLLYPVTDLAGRAPSYRDFGEGFYLTAEQMDNYIALYVADPARRADPRASPLHARSLSGAPPAYVATALADPLRDEGEAYARRLAEAGVPVVAQRHPLLHGFYAMTATRGGREAVAVIAGALRSGMMRRWT